MFDRKEVGEKILNQVLEDERGVFVMLKYEASVTYGIWKFIYSLH